MGIGLEQWRAKIGLWHAFTTGRPLVRRRCCKPLRGRSGRRHDCKRAFKARQKGRQKTRARYHFFSFVAMLTLFVVVDTRINTLNKLSCRLTSTCFYPAIRLAATLFLVGSNKYGSIDKRRNTGTEPRSLISQHSVVTVLAMLLILAGDIEVNPGPCKLVLVLGSLLRTDKHRYDRQRKKGALTLLNLMLAFGISISNCLTIST